MIVLTDNAPNLIGKRVRVSFTEGVAEFVVHSQPPLALMSKDEKIIAYYNSTNPLTLEVI